MKIDKAFLRNFFLYGLIGGISAGFDALVFAVLVKGLGWNEFLGNAVSTHCGIFLSFFLNSRYNFKKTDKLSRRFLSFYLTGLFGLALSSGILGLGNHWEIDPMFTKLAAIIIVAVIQFFINRAAAFRD